MNDPIYKSFRSYAAVLSLAVSGVLAYKGYTVPDESIDTVVAAVTALVVAILNVISKAKEVKK